MSFRGIVWVLASLFCIAVWSLAFYCALQIVKYVFG